MESARKLPFLNEHGAESIPHALEWRSPTDSASNSNHRFETDALRQRGR
jgi:hypothetical protein